MELGIRERGETSSTIYENRTALASSVGSNMEMSRVVVQYNADAGLMAEFELTGESFDYSKSVIFAPKTVPGEQITAYLSKIQRGGFIQPFGCMVAIEEPTFKIISYSENCSELLDLNPNFGWSEQSVNLIGLDVRTLFTPSSWSLLAKAVVSKEISLLNPIWVHSRSTHKPFYAILHRIDVGIVIDLEPAQSGDPAILLAGAVRSQKLSAKAISRLQSLPGGDIGVLCDTVVEDVQNLTGYDRVMVYKFHDDDHGEVVSEIRRSYLEPYLGVHYPATDIPQAARFLFKQNRVRMIYDCNANPVQIIQSEELKQPLSLVNSTLRSTHDCHRQYMAGMGSIASLVMAILINGHSSARLWGLVACHHTSPRYVPFPLRYACEFLMQAFGLQLSMEIQLGSQLAEKNVLHTQTFLCDRLLKDAPFGIMNESPNVMDLVKCDGAALYYNEKYWLLGVTPTESQVKEIAEWLLENHGDSTGLSTDSLVASGCPKAVELGDAVCGMATARITSKDFLFWFRSHCAKAIKWGGAKHVPNEKDDDSTMNPRSSFSVFLEVTKNKSPSWEVSEINAIHSLQHIMTDRLKEIEEKSEKLATISSGNIDYEMHRLDEVRSVTFEMVKLIETAIAPIFGVDSSGFINGWNKKMVELTGLESNDACGRLLVDEIVHEDSRGAAQSLLSRALQGEEDKNVELKLQKFGMQQQKSIVYILVNACTSKDYTNNVVGVCFVGQDITSEKFVMKKLTCLEGDYNAIIQSLNPLIPPIFASDVNACCSEWNAAMTKLTGWARHHVIKKSLHGEIFGGLCKLKGQQDALTEFKVFLYKSIGGHDCEKLPFAFFDRKGKFVEVLLTTNKRTDDCGNVIGFLCFFETIEREAQGLEYKDIGFISKGKELAYLRQEMKNPLNGIHFTHKLLESTTISDDQKQLLETSDACGRQIATLIEDVDLGSSLELKMEEFLLGKVIDAIVSQIMNLVKEKNIQVLHDVPEQIKRLCVYGDEIRLQLLLSDFLFNIVHHAAAPDGWVEIKVSHGLKIIQDGNEFVHLHFRMTHPGKGLPCGLVEEMIGKRNDVGVTEEGLALYLARKLLSVMGGDVRYVREEDKCYFLIDLRLRTISVAGCSKISLS